MIQSDCNLVPNALKPIKSAIETLKIKKKYRGDPLTIGWDDYPFMLSTLLCLRHSMVSSVGSLWNTRRRPWVWADLKALRAVCDVFLFFYHFPIRCSRSGVVLIVSIPSLLFILTRVWTHKKYCLLCYPLRSNSGCLPFRCAYFILNSIKHEHSCKIHYV